MRLGPPCSPRVRVARNSRLGFSPRPRITHQGDAARNRRRRLGNSRCGSEVASNVTLGARDYHAQIGRWLQKDPAPRAGFDFNLMSYCRNDPINYLDPDGRHPGVTITRAIITTLLRWLVFGPLLEQEPDPPKPEPDADPEEVCVGTCECGGQTSCEPPEPEDLTCH